MKDTSITITTGTIIRTIAVLIGVYLIYYLREIVLVILTAVVLSSAIEPGVAWLAKRKIPRVPAVILIYATVFGGFFGLFYFFMPPILEQVSGFVNNLPRYLDVFNRVDPLANFLGPASSALPINDIVAGAKAYLGSISINALSAATAIFGGFISFILVVVFSFYFAVQDKGIDAFLRVVTPPKQHKYIQSLWKRTQHKIGLWMQGQLVLGLVMGVMVYLVLAIFQVQYALVLAVLAAFFELIPVFGPTLSAIPAVIIAFVDGGVTLGMLIIGMYIILQQLENHLIYPIVVTKVVGVPPLLVILALVVGAKLFGFIGVILAIPIAGAIQELVSDYEASRLPVS